ncbi:uncharacterized protein LOC107046460, partial [Diachasma alloeum]|uniref:uncharacterized protein LOC107046460 n=1 Tax=Diachasma alloeum TaxID=454923 RepID=UPI0007384967
MGSLISEQRSRIITILQINVMRLAEELYLVAVEKMQEQKELLDAAKGGDGERHDQSIAAAAMPGSFESALKFPKWDLPDFDGGPSKWMNFRDLYLTIMSNYPQLTSGESYQLVWNSLLEYYDNKRALVNNAITLLFNAPVVVKDSVPSLERLYTEITQALTALEALKRPVAEWDDLLVYIIVKKLDRVSIIEWERTLGTSAESPTWNQLKGFLMSRIRVMHSVQADYAGDGTGASATSAANVAGRAPKGSNGAKVHQENCSSTSSCQKFSSRHHTSIHLKKSRTAGGGNGETPQVNPHLLANAPEFDSTAKAPGATSHAVMHKLSASTSSALLATAIVNVKSGAGELIEGRALIDPCSQVTLTSEWFAQRLRLPRHLSRSVTGVGGSGSVPSKGMIVMELHSRGGKLVYQAEAIVLADLTDYVPVAEAFDPWSILDGLQLADPDYSNTRAIDIILGVDVYSQIIQPGLRRELLDQPIAQQTSFGWILSGKNQTEGVLEQLMSSFHISADDELHNLVKGFWIQQEEFLEVPNETDSSDAECEEYFRSTCTRDETGRYVVTLPFKFSSGLLGNYRHLALKMLRRLDVRFAGNPGLREKYQDFLNEYEELGHMSRVDPGGGESSVIYYLPHHPVVRETSLTTKLRVVFNGSAKSSSRYSLNDLLHEGPKLQAEIFNVITRWRKHRFVYSGDVTKMFRQILVHPADRDFQRMLWRNEDAELVEYQLNTVTYGTRPAPYFAIRTLRQLAEDEGDENPEAREIIMKTTYMDDVYGGSSSEEECKRQITEVNRVFASGGMLLQKWTSNKLKLLRDIACSVNESATHLIDDQECHRALGLNWDSTHDIFFFSLK